MKSIKPSSEGLKAIKALRKAVSRVVEENRKLGIPVAVMQNGKAVLIPVENILTKK